MAILWTARFERAFHSLDRAVQAKVLRALTLLDRETGHPSLRVKPVRGTEGIYEARVDIKYRMTFSIRGDDRILRNVDNHDECLRRP